MYFYILPLQGPDHKVINREFCWMPLSLVDRQVNILKSPFMTA